MAHAVDPEEACSSSATRRPERRHEERKPPSHLLKNLTDQIEKKNVGWDQNLSQTIQNAIDKLDALISKQLAAVLHHPDFQKLEGSYRGLHHLVQNSETSSKLKIKVMSATKDEVRKDLEKAVEFDQSNLFKKVYESEYGHPGGEPYGALIGDYEFTNHPDDLEMLSNISNVAAAAFCPFISAASPQLFGFDSWVELARPRDLEKIFDSIEYVKWRSLRETEDSRFLILTLAAGARPAALRGQPPGRSRSSASRRSRSTRTSDPVPCRTISTPG